MAARLWPCSACGGENAEGMRFCGHCGAKRVETPAGAESGVQDALRSFVAGAVADQLVETGGRLPEERRLITALFADISGFTALADRLDPEQLVDVIDPVISALSTSSAATTATSRSSPGTRSSRSSVHRSATRTTPTGRCS